MRRQNCRPCVVFFFLFIPFDSRKQSSNQNDKVRTKKLAEEILQQECFLFLDVYLEPQDLTAKNIKVSEDRGGDSAGTEGVMLDVYPSIMKKKQVLECAASDHDPEIKQCAYI